MTFLDFFAGLGGFRRGMELAGHRCVGFCEWDKYARASYISMHLLTEEQRQRLSALSLKKRQREILKDEYLNGEWCSDDIRRVDATNIPKADCWCFGAPCQDFSLAGKRKGLEGDRSSLVREVFRILSELREEDRPEWLIYENVKGMLSSNRGYDFLSILLELDEGGYDIEWQIFNSKDFGVPQNRERVYTIGHLRKRGSRKILPIEGSDEKADVRSLSAVPEMFGIDYNVHGKERPIANTIKARYDVGVTNINQNGTAVCVTVKEATKKGYAIAREGDSINLSMPDSKTRRGRVGGGTAQTLDTSCNQGVIMTTNAPMNEKWQVVEITPGVFTWAVWYEKYQRYVAIRKLTPRECFRLQGWDDEYFERAQFVNSDTQLYKQAGNGVTVNVVKAIAERLDG